MPHYSPEAQALEVVGEKWALLIVRDLLRCPLRFQELLGYVADITPRMLSRRLKELEAAGLIEQVATGGHPPVVRYALTAGGRALRPVIRSLCLWTIVHQPRPPRPGETVFAEQTLQTLAFYRDLDQAAAGRPWTFALDDPEPAVWSIVPGDDGWELRAGPAPEAGLRIAAARPIWEVIWRGTLTWADALAEGRVSADGDLAEALRFNRAIESLLRRLSPA
ncbi:MAG TPA: helix-turn-helix domain-containing protein [Dehalococcoidia bacterium]|nr:helix-turn-helix domain-containing protein [Dehalococcoidia bacterium]